MKFWALITLMALWNAAAGQSGARLKATAVHHLRVHEPSDMCPSGDGQHLYMVGDEGLLVRTNLTGEVEQTSAVRGLDYEGVLLWEGRLLVSEEMTRRILVFDPETLEQVDSRSLSYLGGRNKGFESIAYNPVRKCLVLVTERDPVRIVELDSAFRQLGDHPFPKVGDVSGATYSGGMLWLLSDEDATVYALDAADYRLRGQWRIKVLNPEGLAVMGDRLLIVSDDMATLYEFDLPQP